MTADTALSWGCEKGFSHQVADTALSRASKSVWEKLGRDSYLAVRWERIPDGRGCEKGFSHQVVDHTYLSNDPLRRRFTPAY